MNYYTIAWCSFAIHMFVILLMRAGSNQWVNVLLKEATSALAFNNAFTNAITNVLLITSIIYGRMYYAYVTAGISVLVYFSMQLIMCGLRAVA